MGYGRWVHCAIDNSSLENLGSITNLAHNVVCPIFFGFISPQNTSVQVAL
jgi:hypothetical protein